MLTVCWAAKGGSGTTVTAAALALAHDDPTLLVDLAGDVPLVLGSGEIERPGVHDWIASTAATDRLARLEHPVAPTLSVLPAGSPGCSDTGDERWRDLADVLAADPRHVVVDAGTGEPPGELVRRAPHALLVTRACYLALTRACALAARPTGIVLIDEPGRALRRRDVEASIGAPVVATVPIDPGIARAVDAGLALSRLPRAWLEAVGAAT